MSVLPGPVLPSSKSILGVVVVAAVVSAAVVYSSNRVAPIKKLIGPK